jgi:predicted house-cleaning noncanonical NTP pyrophosphatase (MazG superfamily)
MAINKLVRDKVKPMDGEKAMILSLALHRTALVAKMHEEVEEIARTPKAHSEYADVLSALMDLAALNGLEWEEVLAAEQSKRELKGGFSKGLFITDRKGR